MTLLEKIQKDKINAMKSKDTLKKDLLSYIFSEAQKKSMASTNGSKEPTDDQFISIMKSLIESHKEVLRMDLSKEEIKKRQSEIDIMEEYLPQMLMESELKLIVKDFIETIPVAERKKSIGIIMKMLKENFSGRYDGQLASSFIKEMLN